MVVAHGHVATRMGYNRYNSRDWYDECGRDSSKEKTCKDYRRRNANTDDGAGRYTLIVTPGAGLRMPGAGDETSGADGNVCKSADMRTTEHDNSEYRCDKKHSQHDWMGRPMTYV